MQVVSVRDGQGILVYELKQQKRKTHCFPARMQRKKEEDNLNGANQRP